MRPSIIFFDEIDGLAPVRSTRQEQIHSSIVSTLLALMDGLDSRGNYGHRRMSRDLVFTPINPAIIPLSISHQVKW